MESSRESAEKGTALLGTQGVLVVCFERIHQSNLINMGVLPLRRFAGVTPKSLRLLADNSVEADAEPARLAWCPLVLIRVSRSGGEIARFDVVPVIETTLEVDVLKAGGLPPMIVANLLLQSGVAAKKGHYGWKPVRQLSGGHVG